MAQRQSLQVAVPVAEHHAPLIQSRETGDVIPEQEMRGQIKALPFAKSWIHLLAGG